MHHTASHVEIDPCLCLIHVHLNNVAWHYTESFPQRSGHNYVDDLLLRWYFGSIEVFVAIGILRYVQVIGIVLQQSIVWIVFPYALIVVLLVVSVESVEAISNSIGEQLQRVNLRLVVILWVVVLLQRDIQEVGSDSLE